MDAFDRWNCRSHTGFRVKAVSPAAAASIALFAARLALQTVLFPNSLELRTRKAQSFLTPLSPVTVVGLPVAEETTGIRPQQLLLDIEIHLLDIGRGRIVTAVQPHDQAGMLRSR